MKKINVLMGIFALLILSFSSCKKDSTEGPGTTPEPQLSKKEMLAGTSQKSWTRTKTYLNGEETTSSQKACSMDDIHLFKTAGTYEIQSGATKCDPSEQQMVGDWSFGNNETFVIVKYMIGGQPYTINYKIDQLTKTSMKLTMSYQGNNYTDEFVAK
jgi:hypothetical protein